MKKKKKPEQQLFMEPRELLKILKDEQNQRPHPDVEKAMKLVRRALGTEKGTLHVLHLLQGVTEEKPLYFWEIKESLAILLGESHA